MAFKGSQLTNTTLTTQLVLQGNLQSSPKLQVCKSPLISFSACYQAAKQEFRNMKSMNHIIVGTHTTLIINKKGILLTEVNRFGLHCYNPSYTKIKE